MNTLVRTSAWDVESHGQTCIVHKEGTSFLVGVSAFYSSDNLNLLKRVGTLKEALALAERVNAKARLADLDDRITALQDERQNLERGGLAPSTDDLLAALGEAPA